jgi:hypothetical protein
MPKSPGNNPPKTFSLRDPKTQRVVCKIDTQTKVGDYFVDPSCPQYKWAKKIRFLGFSKLPSGFKQNGKGLPSSGYLLLRFLEEKLGAFDLTVAAAEASRIDEKGGRVAVVLNHDDLRAVLKSLRAANNERFQKQQAAVRGLLNERFPQHFEKVDADALTYRGGEISRLLDKGKLIQKLSATDIEGLARFFPRFIQAFGDRFAETKKLLAISESKKATEVVYLEKVIKQYERRLKKSGQSESAWQKFLREYILVFSTNYANALEKESIALQGKYPDFLLIDAYNYLDIFEIKKPSTKIVRKDPSRGNYYWTPELAKAISQTENYIAYAERNAASLREDIRKRKGIEIRVMKPRGFIIAGERKQLKNEIMEDNFRLLNNSMKNVEVILYDELLDNLKNFVKRLKKD